MKHSKRLLLPVVAIFLLSSCQGDDEQMWISVKNGTDSPIVCVFNPKRIDQATRIDRLVIESGESRDISISSDASETPANLLTQQYSNFKVTLGDDTELIFDGESEPVHYARNPFNNDGAWTLTIEEKTYATNGNSSDVMVWNYEFIVKDSHVLK
ncbi:MAG: hypothetical protein WA958_10300 [Tunicatimonas sp.]